MNLIPEATDDRQMIIIQTHLPTTSTSQMFSAVPVRGQTDSRINITFFVVMVSYFPFPVVVNASMCCNLMSLISHCTLNYDGTSRTMAQTAWYLLGLLQTR